jgi:hypothetical protein
MGIPEGAAMEPPTVLFIVHWRLLIFDGLVKSKKYPLSLDGRGLALWSKFQYSTG